jgi:hypothetical protein
MTKGSTPLLGALVAGTLLMATAMLMAVAVNTARAGGMLMASADSRLTPPPIAVSLLTK